MLISGCTTTTMYEAFSAGGSPAEKQGNDKHVVCKRTQKSLFGRYDSGEEKEREREQKKNPQRSIEKAAETATSMFTVLLMLLLPSS